MPPKVTLSDFNSIWIQWTDSNVQCPSKQHQNRGFPRGLGEQGNITKISKGTGNMNTFFGNRGTKLYKLEDKNILSKFIKRGTNHENVWEHGNI